MIEITAGNIDDELRVGDKVLLDGQGPYEVAHRYAFEFGFRINYRIGDCPPCGSTGVVAHGEVVIGKFKIMKITEEDTMYFEIKPGMVCVMQDESVLMCNGDYLVAPHGERVMSSEEAMGRTHSGSAPEFTLREVYHQPSMGVNAFSIQGECIYNAPQKPSKNPKDFPDCEVGTILTSDGCEYVVVSSEGVDLDHEVLVVPVGGDSTEYMAVEEFNEYQEWVKS